MTIYDLPNNERLEALEFAKGIVGDKESWLIGITDLGNKIATTNKYNNLLEKIANTYIKYGPKKACLTYVQNGSDLEGMTATGKKWVLYRNNGFTTRSINCGTLYIDGECIFTSGTIAKAFDYIVNN